MHKTSSFSNTSQQMVRVSHGSNSGKREHSCPRKLHSSTTKESIIAINTFRMTTLGEFLTECASQFQQYGATLNRMQLNVGLMQQWRMQPSSSFTLVTLFSYCKEKKGIKEPHELGNHDHAAPLG